MGELYVSSHFHVSTFDIFSDCCTGRHLSQALDMIVYYGIYQKYKINVLTFNFLMVLFYLPSFSTGILYCTKLWPFIV